MSTTNPILNFTFIPFHNTGSETLSTAIIFDCMCTFLAEIQDTCHQ